MFKCNNKSATAVNLLAKVDVALYFCHKTTQRTAYRIRRQLQVYAIEIATRTISFLSSRVHLNRVSCLLMRRLQIKVYFTAYRTGTTRVQLSTVILMGRELNFNSFFTTATKEHFTINPNISAQYSSRRFLFHQPIVFYNIVQQLHSKNLFCLAKRRNRFAADPVNTSRASIKH